MEGDAVEKSMQYFFRRNLANFITLGRIPLCFASFACALMVMRTHGSTAHWGFLGEILLILTALTDYIDGLVARKLNAVSKIGPLADQMMDKMVYCIIFPTLAVGLMQKDGEQEINHVLLFLALCVTLLVRDHWVNFLRTIADRHQADSSVKKIGKIRTLCALPIACVIYAYCFGRGGYSDLLYTNALFIWVREPFFGNFLIMLELLLFLINVVSAISYTKIYGVYLLDDICEGDLRIRRRILGIFPNLLTLMNAIMGISAMVLAYNGKFHLSMVLLVFAAVFDKLDGAAARKLGLIEEPTPGEKHITLGMILDDIADLISFCIAPAVIAMAYLQNNSGAWMLLLYAILGLARLLYFTFDKHPIPGFFKGLPSPAAALFVGGIIHFCFRLDPEAESLSGLVFVLFFGTGILMNAYAIKYIHFGRLMSRSKKLSRLVTLVIVASIFSSDALGLIAILLMGGYILSPIFVAVPQAHGK
jgi:CDP-diacylglycerol---serine O-phosphatidyltransferase